MNVMQATEMTPVRLPEERRLRFCFEKFCTVHTVAGNFRESQALETIVQQFDKYLRDCKETNADGEAYTPRRIEAVLTKMSKDGGLKCTFRADENGYVQIDKLQVTGG